MQETQETWVRFLGWEGPLVKEMATHSNILAWKIVCPQSPAVYSPKSCKELDMADD